MTRILITGSNGLLGQKIVRQLLKRNVEFLATSQGQNRNSNCPAEKYSSLDITNKEQLAATIRAYKPTAIINTAAMTNVDECEEKEAACRKINVEAVSYLHEISEKENIQLVHVSTDFVFDGEHGPYRETDHRGPLSIYAKSKADSEDILIKGDYQQWAILRTIIVFGEGENLSRSNIVLWAKEALKKGQELKIVDDQFRAPTWADDLAWACIEAALKPAAGIFHISGPETFSVLEMVQRIADFYRLDKSIIVPISSSTLNQKAKRPPRTGFILDKARAELGYKPMTLEQSLAKLG